MQIEVLKGRSAEEERRYSTRMYEGIGSGAVDFGIYLPTAGPFASASDILGVARAAEDLGFASVWTTDHLFTPTELSTPYPYTPTGSYFLTADMPYFDALGLYGVLAASTARVQIGCGVLVAPYRHPIVLGKALASIERFAPGRLVLGLGAGWMREEFDALGVDYARRGARLVEYVAALRTMWSGSASSFDGEFYRWPEAGFGPAPTTAIPIILGGHSDAAVRRAAHHADGWAAITPGSTGGVLADIEERLAFLRTELTAAGRDPDTFRVVFQTPLWISDKPNPRHPLTGPPEAVAESIGKLEAIGITGVTCIVAGDANLVTAVMERFAEEVRPLL